MLKCLTFVGTSSQIQGVFSETINIYSSEVTDNTEHPKPQAFVLAVCAFRSLFGAEFFQSNGLMPKCDM